MKSVVRICVCAGLFASLPVVPAEAQETAAPSTPSPLLVIYREEVKPGRGAAHAKQTRARGRRDLRKRACRSTGSP